MARVAGVNIPDRKHTVIALTHIFGIGLTRAGKICAATRIPPDTKIKDLTEEFQEEREGMLETIRDLTRQVKLKELVIGNFIPPEEARNFDAVENGGRAVWQEEEELWVVPR